MKLYIWQQFSSNHSANFSVVGKFASAEDAKDAEPIIRDIIQQIGDYYREQYTEEQFLLALEKAEFFQLSSIEQSIKEKHKIDEWAQALDWAYYDTPDETVKRYQNLLIVSNNSSTWTGHPPFHQVLKYLGGEVAFSVEGWQSASVSMSCSAPDEITAEKIIKMIGVTEVSGTQVVKGGITRYYIQIPSLDYRVDGKAEREDGKLYFRDLHISISDTEKWDTVTILSKLKSYLEEQGCTNFNYELSEQK